MLTIQSLYLRLKRRKLTRLARAGCYKEAINAYKKWGIAGTDFAADIVGYCHYELSNFEAAIIHLKNRLEIYPNDYNSRLFLARSFKALDKKNEAIDQLMKCLELHTEQSSRILDYLLPLAAQINDEIIYRNTFSNIEKAVEKQNLSNVNLAKILFYQRSDSEITHGMLEGMQLGRFYGAKQITETGCGNYISLGQPEKLRFVRIEDGSDIWVDTCLPYVAEIPDATVMSGSSLILVGDKILSDHLAHKQYGHYVDMQYDSNVLARRNDALLIKKPVSENKIEEGIMLCGLVSDAYGHWFAEFLPKLRFFEKHPRFSQLPIIVDDEMPQSHYDFLIALVSNPIYRLHKGSSLKVRNLLIAPTDTFFPVDLLSGHSVPFEEQSSLTIGALKYIGAKIADRFATNVNPTARIFLSRRHSTWRRLSNEQEIIALLREFNFEVVFSEDFSFEEQVKIFKNAAFIVAPNGSALNNLIFSNPNVKVLMFGQKNLFNWGGWFGSFMELGYRIPYLGGAAIGNEKAKHSDYTIHASLVRQIVTEMLDF